MKKTLFALAALALLTAGTMTAANAQGAPGGIDVNPPRGDYQGGRNCRTIITHHTNAMGNSVTVRRRVCD